MEPFGDIKKVLSKYDITVKDDAYDTLKDICISRRCFLKGEELDIMKASSMVIEDFRSGRLVRITFETPQNI